MSTADRLAGTAFDLDLLQIKKAQVIFLSVTGVILPPWFMYLSLRSDNLIDLSIGYTFIPLMTVILSALLLSERLSRTQYVGIVIAAVGALVFTFRGTLSNLIDFDPHEGFLWMMAVCVARSLYLVMLKRWNMRLKPEEGLFAILIVGVAFTLPGALAHEISRGSPLDYSWQVWRSIAFIGIGMGALYLHLISYGTTHIGATRASLFTYAVPIFVTVESVVVLGSKLQAYQGVGALFVVGSVLIVSRSRNHAFAHVVKQHH